MKYRVHFERFDDHIFCVVFTLFTIYSSPFVGSFHLKAGGPLIRLSVRGEPAISNRYACWVCRASK